MEYTKNYHLPQWVKDDRIMMDDFNEAMGNIDRGITAVRSEARTENQKVSERVEQVAATLPYVTGSYSGRGEEQEITVGFCPSFVIICAGQQGPNADFSAGRTAIAGPNVTSNRVFMTDTGFRLAAVDEKYPLPWVNRAGTIFNYIAFR